MYQTISAVVEALVYIKWLGVAARVEEVFAWGACRVSYRLPLAGVPESDQKVMMKSLRIEDIYPLFPADDLENR